MLTSLISKTELQKSRSNNPSQKRNHPSSKSVHNNILGKKNDGKPMVEQMHKQVIGQFILQIIRQGVMQFFQQIIQKIVDLGIKCILAVPTIESMMTKGVIDCNTRGAWLVGIFFRCGNYIKLAYRDKYSCIKHSTQKFKTAIPRG